MRANSHVIGQEAEDHACRYLLQQGLQLIRRNYRCRGGEIDLICQDQQVLVFVEVRYRQESRFGNAADSVTYTKQRKLIHAASHYLQYYPNRLPCRFDVVTITPQSKQGLETLWIRDAFQVE